MKWLCDFAYECCDYNRFVEEGSCSFSSCSKRDGSRNGPEIAETEGGRACGFEADLTIFAESFEIDQGFSVEALWGRKEAPWPKCCARGPYIFAAPSKLSYPAVQMNSFGFSSYFTYWFAIARGQR